MELQKLSADATDPQLARRYNEMITLIAKRMDFTLPQDVKRNFCKRCYSTYGSSAGIRLKQGVVQITCPSCGDVRRLPYARTGSCDSRTE